MFKKITKCEWCEDELELVERKFFKFLGKKRLKYECEECGRICCELCIVNYTKCPVCFEMYAENYDPLREEYD